MEAICRVCLENSKKLYPLQGHVPNVNEDIANMIKYCTLIQVTIEKGLPNGVCVPCFKTIRIAYNFINQFKESHKKLLENRMLCNQGYSLEIMCNLQDESTQSLDNDNVEKIIIEYCKKDLSLFEGSDEDLVHKNSELIQLEPSYSKQDMFDNVEGTSENYSIAEHVLLNEQEDAVVSNSDDANHKFLNLPEHHEEGTRTVLKKKYIQSFRCPICHRVFSKFEVGFVKHLSTHEGILLKCDKCPLESTLTTDLYVQHYRNSHRFQCYICSKSYGQGSGLSYHMKTHFEKKTYSCSFKNCTKTFLTSWCLRKHLHTHSEIPKFICSKCGSEFKTYASYNYHKKTHDGTRGFLCTECGQTFLQMIHLKYHMWKHTGIKLFKCDTCNKSYTSQTQLKKHKKKLCDIKNAKESVGTEEAS